MQTPKFDFELMIRVMTRCNVRFIVVGGICAVLHGAPLTTYDLDLVHSREPENIDNVLKALEELDAYYRDLANRRIRPKRAVLEGLGHNLLKTKAGPLDLLGSLGKEGTTQDYDALLLHAVDFKLAKDLSIKLLSLEMLIQFKTEAGRNKDLAALPILKSTLREINKGQSLS
jgi:hypothetical protein